MKKPMLFISDKKIIVYRLAKQNRPTTPCRRKGEKEQYFISLMISDSNNTSLCKYAESLRDENGYVNGLMNKYIITKILGYRLNDNIIKYKVDYDRTTDTNNEVLRSNAI